MSYRNITVEGTPYKYVIGRVMTKVRGLGVFDNSTYGIPNCVAQPKSGVVPTTAAVANYIVGPGQIRAMILQRVFGKAPAPYSWRCDKHDFVAMSVTTQPFAAEINGKYPLMADCPKCVRENADDI